MAAAMGFDAIQTLWDVLDHYNKGAGLRDPWLDPDIQPLGLREGELDDLVAFAHECLHPTLVAPGTFAAATR